jgi:hypothetical protein
MTSTRRDFDSIHAYACRVPILSWMSYLWSVQASCFREILVP